MGHKFNYSPEENAGLYSEIVMQLEKAFGHLGEMVIANRDTIKNIKNIKKLMDKDEIKFHEALVDINMGIELFNESLRNITQFIRNAELGELEDIAIYLEKCSLPDFSDALARNSWLESSDIKAFEKNLSEDNIRRMLTEITDIAFGDRNESFLRMFCRSRLVA